MCHILHHDDEHVDPICPTDTYSNNSFPVPLSLSIQGKRFGKRGWGMGLWNMLTQANETGEKWGRDTKRRAQRRRESERGQKVVESGGGNTVAAAVVFHWSLERAGALGARSLCGHMITTPRYSGADEASLLPRLWRERDCLTAKFSKHAA